MARQLGWAAVAVGICLLCGCSGASTEGTTIRKAVTLTLYEGLPHQFYEADALVEEKKAKPTVELHGFPFYRETLALKAEDEEKLKAILGDRRSYQAYSGEKKCGGFHPDYAVGWTVGRKQFLCLICFGCGELRIYSPTGEAYNDIAIKSQGPLKDLLSPYRRNRPPATVP